MGSGEPAADWEAGLVKGEVSLPDKRAGVGIAIDTMAFHQKDLIPCRLAEVMAGISGYCNHPSLEREVVRMRH